MGDAIGVYVCRGCGIAAAMDTASLEKIAAGEQGVATARCHDFLCGDEGTALIRADVVEKGLGKVVVCACSPRALTEAFGRCAAMVERVDLRERVAWCQEPMHEETQALAEDYVRMGIARIARSSPPAPHVPGPEISRTILVVGGGLTGMNAAIHASRAGSPVVLVEKADGLGGHASGTDALVARLSGQGGVTVLTGAEILGISGAPGMFDARVRTGEGEETIRAGAIVLAAGHDPYDPAKLGHLGWGSSPDVITSADLDAMAASGRIARPSDGLKPSSVVFVQCAGSRDKAHLPYCSSICCATSLKQAMALRKLDPEANATILYRDMRTPGLDERIMQDAQEDEGIFLARCDVTGVRKGKRGKLVVEATGSSLGKDLAIEADLVVLASGIVPSTLGKRVLGLSYRQGGECPEARHGFPDSEFVCFPYETRRTGIYAAGTVRSPMTPARCERDAIGAALKAIQCIELTSAGAAVHPRSMDLSLPEFQLERCTQCKRCTEECPFGAIDEDARFTPLPNPTRCRRCGICMGSCPERIISFGNDGVDITAAMIRACGMPDPDEGKPRVLALACENDAYPALDLVGAQRTRIPPAIRFVPVRCLGSVNPVVITQALDRGFDGVLLLGCKRGDDYQCHFATGSELAATRMKNIAEKLGQMALEPERVQIHEVEISDVEGIARIAREFVETMERVGPNPFKGL